MSNTTFTAFNYGHTITSDNQYINFDEGAGELAAIISVGSYTLGDFVDAVSVAMNKIGTQAYSVTLDRVTRKITISSVGVFDLLIATGVQINISAFSLMGFTGIDLIGLDEYEGDLESGSQYVPQFLIQGFIDFQDDQSKASSVVNESANGDVEVISYGDLNFMSGNITMATNITPQQAITENATGVDELRAFMVYITSKAPIEFLHDVDSENDFTNCLLESTPESQNGTGFLLKELYSRNLTGYFESGFLKFRKINS